MDIDDYNIKDRISFINFEFQVEPDLKAPVHRDWGLFYKRKQLLRTATEHFTESLEHKPDGFQSLYERSVCRLELGDVDEALENVEQCLQHYPDRLIAQQHRNNCEYEQNRFESSLAKYANTEHQFPAGRGVRDGPELVTLTIAGAVRRDVIGACLLNMRGAIDKYQTWKNSQIADTRPLWKVLRAKGECDVVSVLVKPKPYVPMMQRMRTKRKQSNMDALYVGLQTADDFAFLAHLQTDKRLFLKHSSASNAVMRDTITDGLRRVKAWENMLWCRKPIYAKRSVKNPEKVRQQTEDALNRIQYQTRRDVFKQLVEIRRLAKCDRDGLRTCVEDVISNYYSIKTKRVFPRKFEFLNEIFNIVAISYLEQGVVVANNLMLLPPPERLSVLLQLPQDKKGDEKSAVGEFGDKNTFVDPDQPDVAYFAYKRKVDEFEKRLQRCAYPIERCYLCHELALLHMNQRKLDEPKLLAIKLVDQAQACGNMVWLFMGHLTGARADLAGGQLVGTGLRLEKLKELLPIFDEFVAHFVKTALLLHENHLALTQHGLAAKL